MPVTNQIAGQERMMRAQISMKMAMMRELLYWIGGVYALGIAGLTIYSIKNRKFPKIAAAPLVLVSTFLAYQIDFAYGNKMERSVPLFPPLPTKCLAGNKKDLNFISLQSETNPRRNFERPYLLVQSAHSSLGVYSKRRKSDL